MSNAFDEAWQVVKMAQHHLGPIRMYDLASNNFQTDEQKAKLKEEFGEYPVMGSAAFFNDNHVKARMTPRQYMEMAYNTGRKDLIGDEYLLDMQEQMMMGRPIGLPYLGVSRRDDGSFKVNSQEGRHRMQSLIDLGQGDVEIPVQIGSNAMFDGKKKHNQYGGFQEMIDALQGARLIQQTGYSDGYTEEDLGDRLKVLENLKIDDPQVWGRNKTFKITPEDWGEHDRF